MSNKTENINRLLSHLKELQTQLEAYNKENPVREIEDIQFQMGQDLKSLSFLFESLYSYNGRSTSHAKKMSSRENGKKGGRPPKQITEARKRINVLETQVIPQLEHDRKMTNDFEEEQKYSEELVQYQIELKELQERLEAFEETKNK